MIFQKLKLNNFGKFHNYEIELKPGINVIYGENEAGKSTIHTFIKGMLFGIERLRGRASNSKDDIYIHYLPWDYPGAFNGSMDIMVGEKEYHLQRSFLSNDKKFSIIDSQTGRTFGQREDHISHLIPGLTESTFMNTISIAQLKARTDTELANGVRDYITNLSTAKSNEINVRKAVKSLTDWKKSIEPSQNKSLLNELQGEIKEGIAKDERIDELSIQLKERKKEEQELIKTKNTLKSHMNSEETKRMEQLPAIMEKYHIYQKLTKQCDELEQRCKEEREMSSAEKEEKNSGEGIKDNINEVVKLNREHMEIDKCISELQREKVNAVQTDRKRNICKSLIPSCICILLSFILIDSISDTLLFTVGIIFIAGIGYIFLNKNSRRKNKESNATIDDCVGRQASMQERVKEILRTNMVTTVEELYKKQEEDLKFHYSIEHNKKQLEDLELRKEELDDHRDAMYDSIMIYMQYFIIAEELSEISIQALEAEIEERKQESIRRQTEINRQYDACKIRIEKLKWEIANMEENEEQLLKNKENYAELEQKIKEGAVEIEAIDLTLNTIQELAADIHDSFGRKLNLEVSHMIGSVTDQKYSDIKVDEKLDVKVGWNGDFVLLDRLSAGTIDQVYFALRLVVADLLLGKEDMPLLLDDSFALYDEKRVTEVLRQIAKRKQTILFSCHKRELELLKKLNIPYHHVDLSLT